MGLYRRIHLRPAPGCTAGDHCEPLGSDGVWTKRRPSPRHLPVAGGLGRMRARVGLIEGQLVGGRDLSPTSPSRHVQERPSPCT
jgi:hypothetical protein